MATMRMPVRRNRLNWIALLLSGMLVGAILVVGLTYLNRAKPEVSVPAVVAPPADVSETPGGRLGGIASDDAANDWQVKQSLSVSAASLDRPNRDLVGGDQTFVDNEPAVLNESVTGGRLGGINNADSANDWQVKQGLTINAPSAGPFVMPNVDRNGADTSMSTATQGNIPAPAYLPGRDEIDPGYLPATAQPAADSSHDLPPLDEERQYRDSGTGAPPAFEPRLSQPQ